MGNIDSFLAESKHQVLKERGGQVAIALEASLAVIPVEYVQRKCVWKGEPTSDLDAVHKIMNDRPSVNWAVRLGALIAIRFNPAAACETLQALSEDDSPDWAYSLTMTCGDRTTVLFASNGTKPRQLPEPLARIITINHSDLLILPGSVMPLGHGRRWKEPILPIATAPSWIYFPATSEAAYVKQLSCRWRQTGDNAA
jgi:hypothetical protein